MTVGCPLTVTRGFGTVGVAWPPCEHITVAPTWTRKPGIYVTTRATLLIITLGPTSSTVAPFPLLM